jgi:16S rRNA (guanine(1405)-N(7))-methyltransferase
MTAEIVERVRRSARYRDVDPELVARLASEELPKARSADDAVKRVKRRLHQAVGAFRPGRAPAVTQRAWPVDDADALRDACAEAMRRHASTRERLPYLDTFYAGIWQLTGIPARLLDLGCGLGPLALPWMNVGNATYHASDVDAGTLDTVRGFLEAIGQPHDVDVRDLVAGPPAADADADVALMLKLVTTLDRQDADAATRLMRSLPAKHAVVSFAARSLGGRGAGRDRTYRERLERLVAEAGRVRGVAEASVPHELVFVLTLDPIDG